MIGAITHSLGGSVGLLVGAVAVFFVVREALTRSSLCTNDEDDDDDDDDDGRRRRAQRRRGKRTPTRTKATRELKSARGAPRSSIKHQRVALTDDEEQDEDEG